ncbi:MAG: ribose-phosphate diphosphokinase [Actinomycetota bacterium]|nr:ribose-phosphate diphosphokinase [Actinomycetota bacterium]
MTKDIAPKKSLRLIAGRSNPELAEEIAEHLGTPLSEVEIEDFANGEVYVRFQENIRGTDVFVIQTHSSPINKQIMEQLIMIDAARRASAKRITAVVPYYGYSRQDKKGRGREPITARLLADLFIAAGVDRVLSVDLHTAQIQGFFDKPFDHLTALPLLVGFFQQKFGPDIVVVSPDAGRVRVAEKFADKLGAPLAILHKRRRADVRNVSEIALEVVGEVQGRRCLLVDDMIDTAGTVTGGAKVLMEFGADEVYACCTHAILSDPAIDRIKNAPIKELVVTNTVPLPPDKKLDNITVLSIAPTLARTIEAVFTDESVSQIFEGDN